MDRKKAEVLGPVLLALSLPALLYPAVRQTVPPEQGLPWTFWLGLALACTGIAVLLRWNRCPCCGKSLRLRARHCTHCGTALAEDGQRRSGQRNKRAKSFLIAGRLYELLSILAAFALLADVLLGDREGWLFLASFALMTAAVLAAYCGTRCPHCHRSISGRDQYCPHCGCTLER